MHTAIEIPTARDMVGKLQGSILSMPEALYTALSPREQDNLSEFLDYAKRYSQRVCLPLSEDPFRDGLGQHLENHGVKYARIPLKSIDTVYYLLEDVDGLIRLTEFISAQERVLN